MGAHTWEDPEIRWKWTVNKDNQDNWPKEAQKKCPIKVIQNAMRAQLSDSLPESIQVSIHVICTLFLLLNTLLALPLSIFVGIHFFIAEGPRPLSLTTGLVARNWSPWPSLKLWLRTQVLLLRSYLAPKPRNSERESIGLTQLWL